MFQPEEYIEDATPCVQCDVEPMERIEEADPVIICGIPCNTYYGTRLRCRKCGKHTGVYTKPGEAFREWNTKINKE